MIDLVISIWYGILGGLIRLLVSLLKNYQTSGKIEFNRLWFFFILLICVGAFSGIVLGISKQLSLLGGYAGIDLLDGYYKSFKRKKIKFR